MTERGRAAVRRDADSLAIGPSSVRWDKTALTFEIDETTVPIPSRLKGVVRVFPEFLAERVLPLDDEGSHHWWPIAPRVRVEVDFSQPAVRWNGYGYVDSNFGDVPLEKSFSRWDWSRAHLTAETAILYDVTTRTGNGRTLALRFDAAGNVSEFEPAALRKLPRGSWGIERTTRADAGHAVRISRELESAPFYTRAILASQVLGESAAAVHESLSLDRFQAPWVQAMLPFRMPRRA